MIDKFIKISAYPAEMSLICLSSERRALAALAERLDNKSVEKSCLVFSNGYCLGLRVKTNKILSILPFLCEYSDTVCIGRSYSEIAMEHGEVLIENDALKVLSSKALGS